MLYPAELRDQPRPPSSASAGIRQGARLRRPSGGERLFGEPHPVADTMRDDLVVEVVGRIAEPGRIAVADEDEGAGPGLQHIGKILAAHDRRRVVDDILFAGDLPGDAAGENG